MKTNLIATTILSSHLTSNLLDESVPEVTLAGFETYAVTLYRFLDGEQVQVFELSGAEMDMLIGDYMKHTHQVLECLHMSPARLDDE